MASGEPLLDVRDLEVDFVGPEQTVHAVRGATFSIARGEPLGLVGESGSGKSVTSLALTGLLPAGRAFVRAGTAFFKGRDLLAMSASDLASVRGAQIAYSFQDPLSSLNPAFTVGQQIAESLILHMRMGRSVARRRTIELLDLVGIPGAKDRIDDYPHQFSGGMRQRVMLAMAIACEPDLLIADEPTTALDVTVQAQVLDLMRRLRAELGMAVLLITHDIGVVAGIAQRTAVMYAGRVVEVSDTAPLLRRPRHPYTGGLLRSIPRLDSPRDQQLIPIDGAPPDLTQRLIGCPFYPRCAYALDRCSREDPRMELVADRHEVACWVKPEQRITQ